jgi:hypothetical protein
MFPTKNTVDLFIEMCNKGGPVNTVVGFLKEDSINAEYKPSIAYLKAAIQFMMDTSSDICTESFCVGFLSCFHLFRLQLEADQMDIGDLEVNLESLSNYVEYLEGEVRELNGKLENTNTGMHEVPSPSQHEGEPSSN